MGNPESGLFWVEVESAIALVKHLWNVLEDDVKLRWKGWKDAIGDAVASLFHELPPRITALASANVCDEQKEVVDIAICKPENNAAAAAIFRGMKATLKAKR